MTHTAVIFGGPSPEHDISVLTGLQTARLAAEAGKNPIALYWSKVGRWYRVDPASEASDYAAGPPSKARELRFVAEPGAGWMTKRRRVDVDAALICCHGGPGRTEPSREPSTLPAFAIPALTQPRPPWLWTNWPSGLWCRRPVCPPWHAAWSAWGRPRTSRLRISLNPVSAVHPLG